MMGSVADVINSAGLLLDIIGVAMLYRYGLPPAGVSRTGAGYLMWGGSHEARKKGRLYVCLSRVALGCLIAGFALQILSNIL